jgi:MFS family permease
MGVLMYPTPVPPAAVLRRLSRIIQPPHLDLTGPFALAAYWVAQSAGTTGAPLVGLALTALLVSRPAIPWKQRALETFVIALALAALWGAGAYVNEHVVKPTFAVPRPNILELAREPPEGPVLKMSAEAFHALPDKRTRTEYMRGGSDAGSGAARTRARALARRNRLLVPVGALVLGHAVRHILPGHGTESLFGETAVGVLPARPVGGGRLLVAVDPPCPFSNRYLRWRHRGDCGWDAGIPARARDPGDTPARPGGAAWARFSTDRRVCGY